MDAAVGYALDTLLEELVSIFGPGLPGESMRDGMGENGAARAGAPEGVRSGYATVAGLRVAGVDLYKDSALVQFNLLADAPLAPGQLKSVEAHIGSCLGFRNVRARVTRPQAARGDAAPPGDANARACAPANPAAPESFAVSENPAAPENSAATEGFTASESFAVSENPAAPENSAAPADFASAAPDAAPPRDGAQPPDSASAAPDAAPPRDGAQPPDSASAAPDAAPPRGGAQPPGFMDALYGPGFEMPEMYGIDDIIAATRGTAGGGQDGGGGAFGRGGARGSAGSAGSAGSGGSGGSAGTAGNSAKSSKRAAADGSAYRGRQGRKPKSARDKIRPGSFENSMKGIDFEDGGYFADNPDVICGVPIENVERWAPISSLSIDATDNLAVRGDITYVSSRAISGGEKHIFEFGLSDDTGSVMVKLFVKSENVCHVEKRLAVGKQVAVYGALQYDGFLREPAMFAIDINTWKRKPLRDDAQVKRVELHMHTQMSALDAVTPAEALIKKAAEWGHPAVAITDHGVVQAFPEAYAAGKKHGIKIIFGVEAYLVDGADDKASYHAIILVKNQAGLKNLYKLVSKSHLEYFYKRPRMPRREIEAHREGLVIGSACEAGELFRAVAGKKADRAELLKIASFYDYLEIQPTLNNAFMIKKGEAESLEELQDMNRTIVSLGEELGKPVVATCDVHFADARSEVFRRILMAGQGYADADAQPPLYFRSTAEMLEEFSYLGAQKAYEVAVANTNAVSGWIDEGVKPIPDGTFNPKIDGAAEDLKEIVEARAAEIYGSPLPGIVRERLDSELGTIISKEFSVLYIIACKLVKKSNEDGYMVGSRGSVGSSLVATMAGITEVNPLPPHYVCPKCRHSEFFTDSDVSSGFDLPSKPCPKCGAELGRDGQDILFEIFLGVKGSEKAPDIDLNFSGEYQTTAHKYVEEVFGSGNVFKAGTIGTIAKKTAYGFVKKYLESKDMAPNKAEEERLTAGCTGVKRTTGQHPGGIVVIPQDCEIYDFTPIQHPADADDTDIVTTHFDFNSLHDTILKLDILGHDDPSMIKMLEDLTGVPSTDVPMNDPQIMSLFTGTEALGVAPEDINSQVGTYGLPEFGTRFVRQMLSEAKPRTFADLLQVSGLSHGTNVWTSNAQDLIKNGVCTISQVIGTRESLVLYLMHKGVEPLAAFNIMEAVRKNRGVSPANEALMLEKGVPEWYIESCKKIEYLFPKAHAAAYVLMAYRQAWYKINRPLAYYAAYFSIRADDFDAGKMTCGLGAVKAYAEELAKSGRNATPREKSIMTILEIIVEMYARDIAFLPVDIYASDAARFTIEGGSIRPPLASLSGLGRAAAMNICDGRAGGPFLSVEDLTFRSKVTKSVVETLRAYGALKSIPESSQMSLFEMAFAR